MIMAEQQPLFTGFLPSAALVDSLSHATCELAAFEKLPSLQTRNASAAVRRGQLLLALADDIQDSAAGGATLSSSTTICLTELLTVVRRTTSLLYSLAAVSALWMLLQTEQVAHQFHFCVRELTSVLDVLPFSVLKLKPDARDQIELLRRQTRRVKIFIDPSELRLRDDLLHLLHADNRMPFDYNKLEQVTRRAGILTASDYEEEIEKLETEVEREAGTGGVVAVAKLNSIISLLKHSKSAIFYNVDDETTPSRRHSPPAKVNNSLVVLNVPEEFRCPITLDLMKDPVILSSGHTYDRSSIARWINSGHQTCPKSGQRLIHMALIPNYALKSLIHQWCKDNNVPVISQDTNVGATSSVMNTQAVDHISATRAAREAVRMTAEFLVGKLAVGSLLTQRQAAYELRLLAKTGMDNRRIIAEAGALPFLVTLLSSRDPLTQENAVTALLNLSILDTNKILIMAAAAIDSIIDVLRSGLAMEARENAAATIFSLSLMDECKVEIGGRPEAVAGLVGLLRDGTPTGKRDALTALVNLALYQGNRAAMVAAGAVAVLMELLMDERAGVTDNALAVLAMLCGCGEGMKEIKENRAMVPIMVDLLRYGSAKGKENSIALLLGLCREGGEEIGRRLLMNPSSVPSLQSLAASGSARAKRKAEALLRLLNRYCSQSQSQSSI